LEGRKVRPETAAKSGMKGRTRFAKDSEEATHLGALAEESQEATEKA
jgi:hypothetical protein